MSVISISIPKDDLKRFDEVVKDLGFSSRSDAIREALHRFTAQHRWVASNEETSPFIATIVYPNKKEDSVHDALHEFDEIIITSTHTHFGGKCVEWVILKGKDMRFKQFVERIAGIKDVSICRCSV